MSSQLNHILSVNPYIPLPAKIEQITIETDDRLIKTFQLVFKERKNQQKFSFVPGQFAELSVLGVGECPIGMASSPTDQDYLEFTVMKMGVVTTALHNME